MKQENEWKKEYVFRQLRDGIFHCVNVQDCDKTPAEVAASYGVCVPDCTQFLRVDNYAGGFRFEWRDSGGAIRITAHNI